MTAQFPHAIDNSMRKELVKCEMAAHYKYELGLQSVESKRVDLHAGGAFAKGMEVMRLAYYVGKQAPAYALSHGVQAVYQAYGNFIPDAKSNKTADRMAGALAFYAVNNPLEAELLKPVRLNDELGIEVGFNYPIGIAHPDDDNKELTYCGKFDMLALDENGDAWVVDEKTTSQMGDKWANQWLLDSQITGYCWGAQRLLQEHGINAEVKGAYINGIAIRLRDYEHMRIPTYRQDWEVERWYKQMRADVIRWRESYRAQDHDQALDHACATYNNPCEYSPLCKSRNPERLIDGSYVVRRWNPLTREESST